VSLYTKACRRFLRMLPQDRAAEFERQTKRPNFRAGDRVVTKDGRRNGVVRKLKTTMDTEWWARVKFDVEPEPLWVPVSLLRRVDP
jgi:hypothetical protein